MNDVAIYLVEPKSVDDLYPFSILHCAWELRCGAFRLFEKYTRYFPQASFRYLGRAEHLASFIAREYPQNSHTVLQADSLLILTGNALPKFGFSTEILELLKENENAVYLENERGDIVGVLLRGEAAKIISENLGKAQGDIFFEDVIELVAPHIASRRVVSVVSAVILRYLWDAIANNASAIADDANISAGKQQNFTDRIKCASQINSSQIFVAGNLAISCGVVLDATDGPIIIGENVRIMANSVIMGPCAIGNNSIIKIGAKIYGETSFGDFCKIGGEVENSIAHAYSNKQHDGFLGHSYLGEWVNLGADTNTSDLKNTYSPIVARLQGRRIPTGRIMLGLLCGDHTKSGINTMFTTGTVAGVSSSVVGADYAPSVIRSFSFGGREDSPLYNIERALDTAGIVMARRGKNLLPEEELLLRTEYHATLSR